MGIKKMENKMLDIGGGMQLLTNVPEGTCPECALKHDPKQPHNQQSLFYQYKFYGQHKRWPTWKDAMEHCSDEVKEFWIRELSEQGIKIGGEDQ